MLPNKILEYLQKEPDEVLFQKRILFLFKEIDDDIANQLVAYLLYLDSQDNSKPIYLYINSPGGSVTAGMAIYDTIQHIKSEVVTICVEFAGGMSSLLLMAGTKGRRRALINSRIMICPPSGGTQCIGKDIEIQAQEIMMLQRQFYKIYASETGQLLERIEGDMSKEFFLSSYEAKEYGVIDRVIDREQLKTGHL